MIVFSVMIWVIGAMFTGGFIQYEQRPHNDLMAKYLTIVVWPLLLGTVLAERRRFDSDKASNWSSNRI